MEVLVPFDPSEPKERLSAVLSDTERRQLAVAMLADVIAAIEAAGQTPVVLTPTSDAVTLDCVVVCDDRPLSPAVTAQVQDRLRSGANAVAVLMADCALATASAVDGLINTHGSLVLVPGRGGGTNALVIEDAGFSTDFHGASILDHRREADTLGITAVEYDSMRLSTDIDEPADLPEVLLHTDGTAASQLLSWGFSLEVTDGRVAVTR
jgi:2-phospho-L-lactate guanylyltransferase CofC